MPISVARLGRFAKRYSAVSPVGFFYKCCKSSTLIKRYYIEKKHIFVLGTSPALYWIPPSSLDRGGAAPWSPRPRFPELLLPKLADLTHQLAGLIQPR